jgi:hypothetical protein
MTTGMITNGMRYKTTGFDKEIATLVRITKASIIRIIKRVFRVTFNTSERKCARKYQRVR